MIQTVLLFLSAVCLLLFPVFKDITTSAGTIKADELVHQVKDIVIYDGNAHAVKISNPDTMYYMFRTLQNMKRAAIQVPSNIQSIEDALRLVSFTGTNTETLHYKSYKIPMPMVLPPFHIEVVPDVRKLLGYSFQSQQLVLLDAQEPGSLIDRIVEKYKRKNASRFSGLQEWLNTNPYGQRVRSDFFRDMKGGFMSLHKPRFQELQKGLLCGQHALNNIFQNYGGPIPAHFVSTTETKTRSPSPASRSIFRYLKTTFAPAGASSPKNFDLGTFCNKEYEKMKQEVGGEPEAVREHKCLANGDFSYYVLANAVRTFPQFYIDMLPTLLIDTPLNQDKNDRAEAALLDAFEKHNLVGILLLTTAEHGRGGHYVAIVRFFNGLTVLDSMEKKSFDSYEYHDSLSMLRVLKSEFITKRSRRTARPQIIPIAIFLRK